MSVDPELAEFAQDTVEVLDVTTMNTFQGGEHTREAIGAGTSYSAHLNLTTPEIEDGGELVNPTGTVTFLQVIAIDPRAHLLLPARFSPREVAILRVRQPVDEDPAGGGHHTVVEI